eukprot:TRINITY_DN25342_c0_g1_i1.p1 TRINITY_DN25342_c0_g1~~TRINITY_DN25342_c0_g1_i1.p1  ORF type:complete len:577 (+),score=134.69 TRINITY_DN25342_c0_g1_i1:55-1731(+)
MESATPMKRKRAEEGGDSDHGDDDDDDDLGEEGEEEDDDQGEDEEDGSSDGEIEEGVPAKLSQCFDEEGFVVVVVATLGSRYAPAAADEGAPPPKVRRVDGKREFRIWSPLLCAWSKVFSEMLGAAADQTAARRIEVSDFSEDTVDACLQFMYTGKLRLRVEKKTPPYLDLLLEVSKFADKYAISELKETAKEKLSRLPTSMVTVSQLLSVGFVLSELHDMDFAVAELKGAGFSASDLKALRITAGALRRGGYTAEEMLVAGYTVNNLVCAYFTKSQLSPPGTAELTADGLKGKGFSAPALRRAGLSTAYLKVAGFTASDLELAGFTLKEIVAGGFSMGDLKVRFTVLQLKEAGATAKDLRLGGVTAAELKAAAFLVAELVKAEYTSEELSAAGVSAADVSAAGSQLALEMYQERIKALQATIDKGRPKPTDSVFSAAVHSNSSVQAFLRSSDKKMEFKCGGGIAKARCYADFLSKGSPVFPDFDSGKSTCSCEKNPNPTYSVTAEADGVGQGAVVNITKTTEFQILAGKQYDAKVVELEKVRAEFQKLKDETAAAAK